MYNLAEKLLRDDLGSHTGRELQEFTVKLLAEQVVLLKENASNRERALKIYGLQRTNGEDRVAS